MQRILAAATANGFRPVAMEDHAMLMIEYLVDGFGSAADLGRREAL